jgi:hypothetical protein
MVHVASSQRTCGDEAKDRRVDAMGCIRRIYPNIAIFVVLGHTDSLVISFLPQGLIERIKHSANPLPP